MSQSNSPTGTINGQPNLQLQGGAAIVAPVSAFPGGIPSNALVVLPLSKPSDELGEALKQGPVVVSVDDMWKLLGFNGPAVHVQDADGRPIAIGLEDLLAGLEKHWEEDSEDLGRGRMFAQELARYKRFEKAEKVLAKVVALGGTGEDWLALGITQIEQEKWDRAEGTLKGAQSLLPENPYPALHLAKTFQGQGDHEQERQMVEKSIELAPSNVDAWAYLFASLQKRLGDEEAEKAVVELAEREQNRRTAAPFIAIQGIYAAFDETRDKAVPWAKKAVERNENDPLALISLSALYGQQGELDKVIELLAKHEAKMTQDVRLAHNYFEALFQKRQLDRVTKLLNALAGSPNREVKQFAIERSKLVAQYLQQQQQQLAQAGQQRRA